MFHKMFMYHAYEIVKTNFLALNNLKNVTSSNYQIKSPVFRVN